MHNLSHTAALQPACAAHRAFSCSIGTFGIRPVLDDASVHYTPSTCTVQCCQEMSHAPVTCMQHACILPCSTRDSHCMQLALILTRMNKIAPHTCSVAPDRMARLMSRIDLKCGAHSGHSFSFSPKLRKLKEWPHTKWTAGSSNGVPLSAHLLF